MVSNINSDNKIFYNFLKFFYYERGPSPCKRPTQSRRYMRPIRGPCLFQVASKVLASTV